MFGTTCVVFKNMIDTRFNNNMKGEAKRALKAIHNFELYIHFFFYK